MPISLKPVDLGFDIRKIHKVATRIEQKQGWQPEADALHTVADNGDVVLKKPRAYSGEKKVKAKQRDQELRTGRKSAQRIAIEQAVDVIKHAKSWDHLHEQLAKLGMIYVKQGSGAIIFVRDQFIKASSVHRDAALTKMQKRLGDYQPCDGELIIEIPGPQPLLPSPQTRLKPEKNYFELYQDFRDKQKQARTEFNTTLKSKYQRLIAHHRAEKQQLYQSLQSSGYHNRSIEAQALRSQLLASHAIAKAELKQQQKQLRQAFNTQPKHLYYDFNTWKSGYIAYEHKVIKQQQQEREAALSKQMQEMALKKPLPVQSVAMKNSSPITTATVEKGVIDAKTLKENDLKRQLAKKHCYGYFVADQQAPVAAPEGIKNYQLHILFDQLVYCKIDSDDVAFVDTPKGIYLLENSEETVLAALQLAIEKYGRHFTVNGDAEFRMLCAELAAKHGFNIDDIQPDIDRFKNQTEANEIESDDDDEDSGLRMW